MFSFAPTRFLLTEVHENDYLISPYCGVQTRKILQPTQPPKNQLHPSSTCFLLRQRIQVITPHAPDKNNFHASASVEYQTPTDQLMQSR